MHRRRDPSLFAPRDFDVSPYFEVIKPIVQNGFNHHSLIWKEPIRDDLELEQNTETQQVKDDQEETTEQPVAQTVRPLLPQDNAEDTPIDEGVTFNKGAKPNPELSD